MTLRELMEKRARLVAEMRALNNKPEGEAGDLSDAQNTRFTELRADLERTEGAISRQQLLDEADRRAGGAPIAGDPDQNFDREVRGRYSLVRAIAGAAGLDVDDSFEREASAEIKRRSGGQFKGLAVPTMVFERRVVTTTAPVGGPGANIIATDFRGDQFIDILRAQMVTQRLGATVLSGLRGNVDIPRLKTSATTGWVAENAALSPSDMAFDKVSMALKRVGVITEASHNMLMQSTPDIEALFRNDFAFVLAQALDSAAIKGGGSNEPVGVLGTSAVDKTTDMSTPSWDAVLDLINVVEEANAIVTGFVMRPLAATTLRKTPKVDSTDSVMVMEEPGSLAGYPVARTTLVPIVDATPDTTSVIAGNWADLLIGTWSAFDVLVNPYESTAYAKGNISIRGMLSADIGLRHPESFAAAIDFPAE